MHFKLKKSMNIKKIVIYGVAIFILIGCFVCYAILTKNQRYKKMVFEIVYPSDTLFTVADLEFYVKKNCPDVVGKFSDSVNLIDFEKKLEEYPYLEFVDVITNQGVVIVKAKQEKVIAKVFSAENKRFYLAKSGRILPDNSPLSAGRVVVANGKISGKDNPIDIIAKIDSLQKLKGVFPSVYAVWKIADYLDEDPFWEAQIGQIHADENGDITLIPTVGDHLVIFGKIRYCDDASREVKKRFNNLKNVYKQGFKITGWDKYKTINLKFGQEIPCERRVE